MSDIGKRVAIVGALGGFGHSLAHEMLKEGVEVLGIDVLDPGAAIPVHFSHILHELKEKPGFHFLPADLRSLETDDLLIEGQAIDTLFYCASASPYRIGDTPKSLIRDIHLDGAKRLVDLALGMGEIHVVVPQWIPPRRNAPRLEHPGWITLFECEAELCELIAGNPFVCTLPLPSLIGAGQSLRTPPLANILQLLARIPVTENFALATDSTVYLSSITSIISNLYISNNLRDLHNEVDKSPELLVSHKSLFLALSERFDLPDKERAELLAEVNFSPNELPSLPSEVEEVLDHLAEWLFSLPHTPPADWPAVPARERRIMRSKRRRQKRNEQAGR